MKTIDAETTEKLRGYLSRRLAHMLDDVDSQRRPVERAANALLAASHNATATANGEYYEPAGFVPRLGEAEFAAGRLYQLRKDIQVLRGIAGILDLEIESEP